MIDASQRPPASLYEVLGNPAPSTSIRGETITTKAKETLDNDVEMLLLEELIEHV
jgi:hypothetical protein